jgi:hypothetical protein
MNIDYLWADFTFKGNQKGDIKGNQKGNIKCYAPERANTKQPF